MVCLICCMSLGYNEPLGHRFVVFLACKHTKHERSKPLKLNIVAAKVCLLLLSLLACMQPFSSDNHKRISLPSFYKKNSQIKQHFTLWNLIFYLGSSVL